MRLYEPQKKIVSIPDGRIHVLKSGCIHILERCLPSGNSIHTIFTRDFESIHMVLTTATIYYYGIDTKIYKPKVTKLSYSQADDCFYIDTGIQDAHIKAFEKEQVKEALYLKYNAQ